MGVMIRKRSAVTAIPATAFYVVLAYGVSWVPWIPPNRHRTRRIHQPGSLNHPSARHRYPATRNRHPEPTPLPEQREGASVVSRDHCAGQKPGPAREKLPRHASLAPGMTSGGGDWGEMPSPGSRGGHGRLVPESMAGHRGMTDRQRVRDRRTSPSERCTTLALAACNAGIRRPRSGRRSTPGLRAASTARNHPGDSAP